MKGLLKYLAPFAPDQSGAASVFYDMNCVTVVCDAGGCIGNYCGFDEPRWFEHKSPIFSAGLRDMDAILGRDDKMVGKLKLVCDRFKPEFAVLVGTPVPAVIGTDYLALKKMASKRCGLPVLGVECSGTNLYDAGESRAYQELFRALAEIEPSGEETVRAKTTGEADERILGIIGATPLELGDIHADEKLREYYRKQGYTNVFCYGMGDGYEAVKKAGLAEKNIVLSPAGIGAAEYLKETFGTPYEADYPLLTEEFINEINEKAAGKKVLVIHQQFAANAARAALSGSDITVGTFFELNATYKKDGDIHFETEESLRATILDGGYDLVIADEILKKAVREYKGEWISFPHFAVSGTRD